MSGQRRRIARTWAAAVVVAAALALAFAASPALAADPPDFGTPSASSSYGESIAFRQPVTLGAVPDRVELLLETPGAAGPDVIDIPPPPRAGETTLDFDLDLSDGHIVPNTTFMARWRITDEDGTVTIGPEATLRYVDDRVDWQTVEGDLVRVHWYEGGAALGRRALAIGEQAVEETAALLGVTETEPIDFYVYADQETFYGALGPGTRENVGGLAHSNIRTMFALIAPTDIDASWVEVVVPHELVHLVYATAIDNPYHAPPHWLNEGLATYLSEGYTAADRNLVADVARDGSIIPLEGLAGAFPTTRDRFFLAYAESVSAVDFMVHAYGRDALVALIRSYATGVSDDEAFEAALGVDIAGFETAWLESVGADAPIRYGPQPAPAGPVPEGWEGEAPAPSVGPGGTPRPGEAPTSPRPRAGADGGIDVLPVAIAALVVVGIVVAVAVIRRRRVSPPVP